MGFDTITINVKLATEIGLEQAIVLSTIREWHNFNRHNPSFVRGEYVWCLCSNKQLKDTFPFLSDRVVRNTLDKLVGNGLVTKCDREGKKEYWLSLTKNGLALFEGGTVVISKPEVEKGKALTIEEKRAVLQEKCEPYVSQYGREMIDAFVSYWGEANGNSLRCEIAKRKSGAFEVSRRLATWASKDYNQTPVSIKKERKPIWEEMGLTREQYLKLQGK